MPLESSICCPSRILPPSSCAAQDSILLWVGWERYEPLWGLPHRHTHLLSPAGEITSWLLLSWPWAVPPQMKGGTSKVTFSYSLQGIQTCIFLLLLFQQCARTSLIDSWTFTKALQGLSKTVFLTGFQTTVKRDWNCFMDQQKGHSQDLGQYVCFWRNGVGNAPCRSFGVWWCIPQLWQWNFFSY